MSRVFAIHEHRTWSVEQQRLVPKYDISAASEYGEIRYLLSASLSPFNPGEAVRLIREALEVSDFCQDDYLIMIGNPCFIAWTAALAADMCGGTLRLLQWSGKEQRYTALVTELWTEEMEYQEDD